MRLALCQINATVGDIAGNAQRISDGLRAAHAAGAELVLFPELALTGYPPEDLLLREHFLADARAVLEELAREVTGTTAIVGFPELADGLLYNAAAVLADGDVQSVYRKLHLPNYGVFDERRYFTPGAGGVTIVMGEHRVGLSVCEDLWQPGPPATEEARAGAQLIVNISASPYHAGKGAERERLFASRALECNAHIAFCALVGGQDELVFDGHSFVLDPTGATIARADQFVEELLVCDLDLPPVEDPPSSPSEQPEIAAESPAPITLAARRPAPGAGRPPRPPLAPVEAEVYAALELGLRDYVQKNGFARVVLGLSGGIDSALVACLAADALGSERVNVAIMPSPYSSSATQSDAHALAGALGARVHELQIEAVMDAYAHALHADFAGLPPDLTEENLQARIRGNLLMALSNKFGWLVLTTGNKSEMSVGYTTLYGDLAGGFAVIKDVPKTLVYRLCEWRNSPAGAAAGDGAPSRAPSPIPASVLTRPPTAELRHDQRDEDSLPPYELLDRILHGYIELDHGRERLIADGLPAEEVDRTIRLVDLAEYKRRQAPPGIKVTTRAFGRDRRMPITNRYRG
ncbi:MAG TPA: NAD+ synthase [Solirubrobacteraceae bacterium]|jgi:NAD+ synthase (glutamine-hydrolysing)|nr:NAD+ synthase [Solirubrobacteraceae bacterium]